jgi:PLD-like domain
MAFQLLCQPFRDGPSALSFLEAGLGDEDVSSFMVISAWVRRSGLELLAPAIDALRQRGGTARLIFGVDLGGTTRQGVELAKRTFDTVHVFHDPAGGTFHPKLYLATTKDSRGYALVGSNNLTAGGLWHNYETAVLATLKTDADVRFALEMQAFANQLTQDRRVCKALTGAVCRRLEREGWLTDEARAGRTTEDRPRRKRSGSSARSTLFVPSSIAKRSRPIRPSTPVKGRSIGTAARQKIAISPDSWWKRLGAGEAQRLERGHVTGNVALTNVPAGQDRARFFRDVFFATERWQTGPADPRTELASLHVQVELDGRALGAHPVELLFRAYRSDRGRATTVMRLSPALRAHMRARDITGWYLLLERSSLGRYRLTIAPAQPA